MINHESINIRTGEIVVGDPNTEAGPWLLEIADPASYGLDRAWAEIVLPDGRIEGAAIGLADDLLHCEDGNGETCTFPAGRWAEAIAWLSARVLTLPPAYHGDLRPDAYRPKA